MRFQTSKNLAVMKMFGDVQLADLQKPSTHCFGKTGLQPHLLFTGSCHIFVLLTKQNCTIV